MTHQPLSVCIFGFDARDGDGRTWSIATGLEESGVTVLFCRTIVNGFLAKYRDLYRKWHKLEGPIDAVYVVFMGYYLMPLAWYLARRRGARVVLDAMISQHDTEVHDRKRISAWSPRAWFLWIADWCAFHMADAIVADTEAHREFFVTHFGVARERILVAPLGCRFDRFVPAPEPRNPVPIVEFHGSFIPLQGIEHIMRAAKLLQDQSVHVLFRIIGDGQTYPLARRLCDEFALTNVEFLGRQPPESIPGYIQGADICLGIFGTTEKALRVIPNKVYECLASGKPVITERSPASIAWLHDEEDVLLVEPGNGEAIARAIAELVRDESLRKRLGEGARETSLLQFSPRAIVQELLSHLGV